MVLVPSFTLDSQAGALLPLMHTQAISSILEQPSERSDSYSVSDTGRREKRHHHFPFDVILFEKHSLWCHRDRFRGDDRLVGRSRLPSRPFDPGSPALAPSLLAFTTSKLGR